jgi:hypothetical protein
LLGANRAIETFRVRISLDYEALSPQRSHRALPVLQQRSAEPLTDQLGLDKQGLQLILERRNSPQRVKAPNGAIRLRNDKRDVSAFDLFWKVSELVLARAHELF